MGLGRCRNQKFSFEILSVIHADMSSPKKDTSVKLRKGMEVSDVNLGIIDILVLFKAMGLDEIRERSLVRTVKGVEAEPRTVSVWSTGREGGAGKGAEEMLLIQESGEVSLFLY